MITTEHSAGPGWTSKRISLAVFFICLIVYAITASPVTYPGISASYLARHLALDPFPSFTDPLWGWLIKAVAACSGQSPWILNLTSAVLVAGAAALLASGLMRTGPRTLPNRPGNPACARLGALAGVAYFAVSIPVWLCATRAHPLAMDVLLVAIIYRLFAGFLHANSLRALMAAAFVYGIGLVEYSSLYLATPASGLLVLYLLFARRLLSVRIIVRLTLCLLAGLLLYLPATLAHLGDSSLGWREIDTVWQLFFEVFREQYLAIKFSLPEIGWLTTALVTGLPFFMAVNYRVREVYQSELEPSRLILIAVMLAVLVAVLFNFDLAPWALTQTTSILVAPYVMAAVAFGCLLAHVLEVSEIRWIKRKGVALFAMVSIALVIGSAVLNFRIVDGRTARPVDRYVAEIVQQSGDLQWLFTTGELDNEIRLAGGRSGRDLHLINFRDASSPWQKRYFASLIEDVRLRGLLDVDLFVALREWVKDPAAVHGMAIMSFPDWWLSGGYRAVPSVTFYRAAPITNQLDAAALTGAFVAFWTDYRPAFEAFRADHDSPARPWFPYIRRNLTRMANEIGVLAQDAGDIAAARDLYTIAREIDDANVSAMVNLAGLARESNGEDAGELAAEVDAYFARSKGAVNFDRVIAEYGSIRSSEIHSAKGVALAMAGDERRAIADLQRGFDIGGSNTMNRLWLANLYKGQQEFDKSDAQFEEILRLDPGNIPALAGLARNAVAAGNYDRAEELHEKLKTAGADKEVLAINATILASARGNHAEGLRLLLGMDEKNLSTPEIQSVIARMASMAGDEAQYRKAIANLTAMPDAGLDGSLALALHEVVEGNLEKARERSDVTLRKYPASLAALNLGIRLRTVMGDLEAAGELIRPIMSQDPGHPAANYLQARLQIQDGKLDLAEASLRASIEREPRDIVINDLAYVLFLRNKLDEAEVLARRVTEMAPNLASPWDTLAEVQLARGEFGPAEESIKQAIRLNPANTAYLVVQAQIAIKAGRTAEAEKQIRALLAMKELPENQQATIRGLAGQIGIK